jgi:hypothetical protein
MTIVELIWNFAWSTYHYGRAEALDELKDICTDVRLIKYVSECVDEDGNLLSGDCEDPLFFPYPYKNELYRPNDSKRPAPRRMLNPNAN